MIFFKKANFTRKLSTHFSTICQKVVHKVIFCPLGFHKLGHFSVTERKILVQNNYPAIEQNIASSCLYCGFNKVKKIYK